MPVGPRQTRKIALWVLTMGLLVTLLVEPAHADDQTGLGPPAPSVVVPASTQLTETAQPTRVDAALFGLHDGTEQAPRLDAVRIWDAGVRWDEVQTSSASPEWTNLDARVESALARGASEVLYVLGSTPAWAAEDPELDSYYSDGSASVPADLDSWRAWVRAVVERYKGRITSYQIWNEANLSWFFAGSPQTMARLTKIAADEIRAVDASAKVVSPSVVLRLGRTEWVQEYLAELRNLGSSVDAFAVHGYVWLENGPANGTADERRGVVAAVAQVLAQFELAIPIWDTELNFGNTRDNGWPIYTYTEAEAATVLARSYIDSQRLGVARLFWYGWDKHVLGINMTDPVSGSPTAVAHAFYRLRDWVAGASWYGCESTDGVLQCPVRRGSKRYLLSMTDLLGTQPRLLVLPRVRTVCPLIGSCSKQATVTVGDAPVLVRLGRDKPSSRDSLQSRQSVAGVCRDCSAHKANRNKAKRNKAKRHKVKRHKRSRTSQGMAATRTYRR